MNFFKNIKKNNGAQQMAFELNKPFEKDRNHSLGGKSFYFFDFDENIAFLNTPTILFHKKTNREIFISGTEFSLSHENIGRRGPYKDYRIVPDDQTGSFRNFRDQKISKIKKAFGKKQKFIDDIKLTLKTNPTEWQGPSWSCFYHAVFNKRPLALITARGHSPETIKQGVREFVKAGFLPHEPNYLSVMPVNDSETKESLLQGQDFESVSQLKKIAIKRAFKKAIEVYGDKPHRFGMSDDDKKNIQLITEAMHELKIDNPNLSFFVIETSHGQFTKKEIFLPRVNPNKTSIKNTSQLHLPLEHL